MCPALYSRNVNSAVILELQRRCLVCRNRKIVLDVFVLLCRRSTAQHVNSLEQPAQHQQASVTSNSVSLEFVFSCYALEIMIKGYPHPLPPEHIQSQLSFFGPMDVFWVFFFCSFPAHFCICGLLLFLVLYKFGRKMIKATNPVPLLTRLDTLICTNNDVWICPRVSIVTCVGGDHSDF